VLEEFFRPGRMLEDVQELAQPAILPAVDGTGAAALLVAPVGGHAQFRDLVHFAGADLDLDALLFRPDHAGVERLIAVRLGRADVILEAAGHHRIGAVQDAEGAIAIGDVVDDDAEGRDIRQLLERHVLALHLAPDRVGRLFAAGDGRLDPLLLQRARQLGDDAVGARLAAFAQEGQALEDGIARLLVEVGERQVLQFVLHLVHADALGQRGVDLQRLAGDALALLDVADVVEGLHVVQAVGQLHQQDPNVLGHGEDELAEVLGVLGVVGLQLDARQLGDAVDQPRDLLAEEMLDLLEGCLGILDRIVEQRRDDGGAVQLHLGQDAGDLEGMAEIGVAGGPLLGAVGLHRKNIGAVEGVLIRAGVVGLDGLNELELADHRG
jgi:hypothetical protein